MAAVTVALSRDDITMNQLDQRATWLEASMTHYLAAGDMERAAELGTDAGMLREAREIISQQAAIDDERNGVTRRKRP